MTVWCVLDGLCGLEAIFSSSEKAQAYVAERDRHDGCGTATITDELIDERVGWVSRLFWTAQIDTKTCEIKSRQQGYSIAPSGDIRGQVVEHNPKSRYIHSKSWVSEEHARKLVALAHEAWLRNRAAKPETPAT